MTPRPPTSTLFPYTTLFRSNVNAVILQVRPMCDALYPSQLEPWSEFLAARAGKAPDPAWDPLAHAVEAAHKRGLRSEEHTSELQCYISYAVFCLKKKKSNVG